MFRELIKNRKTSLGKARIAIYGVGFLLFCFILYQNVFRIERRKFDLSGLSVLAYNTFSIPAKRSISNFEITINFRNLQINLNDLRVKISRTHPVLFRKLNSPIATREKLKELLYEEEPTEWPTGSLISHKRTIYLLDGDNLRPFISNKIFSSFGYSNYQIKEMTDSQFEQFELGKTINQEDLSEDGFPSGIIIKSGERYYLTGSKELYPILSESLILSVWNNFNYIETGTVDSRKMKNLNCWILSPKTVTCQLEKDSILKSSGTIYALNILGLPQEKVDKINVHIKISHIPTFQEIKNDLKNLLW